MEFVRLIDLCGRTLAFFLIFLILSLASPGGVAAAPPRMRPYTGIGVVVFRQADNSKSQELQLQLYKEPGLSRVGMLNRSRLSVNEWIFGLQEGNPPLVVSARKGAWLRIYYDDAGREAWIDPQNKGRFQSWEQYLKRQTGRLLPGLQPKYYQLQQQPGGSLLATLTPKQEFKVLKLENDWGTVLADQAQIGWLRWRDEDGRLLMGINP
jgi:SH3-like domain-containing protein